MRVPAFAPLWDVNQGGRRRRADAVAFVPRAIIAIVQMIVYSVPTVEQLAESGRLLSVRVIFQQISPLVTVPARMFILKIVFINNFVE